jgi:hypothetical protein
LGYKGPIFKQRRTDAKAFDARAAGHGSFAGGEYHLDAPELRIRRWRHRHGVVRLGRQFGGESYAITVSGGDTTDFPPFTYQNGAADNTGIAYQATYLSFTTDLFNGSPGANRQLRLPVLPLPSGGGTVSLDLSNPAQAERFNCSPYRSFVSGSVTASPGSTTPTAVPTLSDWALTAMAILMFACGLAIIARASRKATAE